MNTALLWTAIGSAAAVLAVGLTAWQIRLQLKERRQSQRPGGPEKMRSLGSGGLPVVVPLGLLPAEVRGRDALLTELRRSLVHRPGRPGRTWVLAGMGGLGKSTVALAIAETARARGWRVWWVTATDTASLTGGMLEVLHQLGAPESVTQPVREGDPIAAERVWVFLNGAHQGGRRWLLIYDNADSVDVLAAHGATSPADGTGWLRPDPSGMIVVTTRVKDPQAWGPRVTFRELRSLDINTAAQVLADLAPSIADPTGEQSRQLGRRLGGLPLALYLAGSYLASPFARWHSFGDYQHALDSAELPGVLAELDSVGAQDRVTIQQTWALSLKALSAGGQPQSRPLLFLVSCYEPATPIPAALLQPDLLVGVLRLCEQSSNYVSDNLVAEQRRRLRDTGLHGLASVGLIEVVSSDQPEDWAITVHPVVADAFRSRMLTTERQDLPMIGQTAVLLLRATSEGLDHRRATVWPTWRRLVAHLIALLEWLASYLDADTLTTLVDITERATAALMRSGDVAAAEKVAYCAVGAASRLGDEHLAKVTALGGMARVFAGQGRYKDSEELYRQALAGRRHVLGDDHPATLHIWQHLAWVIALQGQYQEAEQMFIQVLSRRRRALGEDHPDTLDTRRNLADTMWSQGRYAEAEQLYLQVLADYQRFLGNDHPDTLSTLRNLAGAISGQGRYPEAEQIYRQVLADQQRVLGKDHHRTLVTRHELAQVISHQGRKEDAEQSFRHVLADRRRILGDDHPATMATRKALEQLLAAQSHVAN